MRRLGRTLLEAPAGEASTRVLGGAAVRLDGDVDRLVVARAGQPELEVDVGVRRARTRPTASISPSASLAQHPDLVVLAGGGRRNLRQIEDEPSVVLAPARTASPRRGRRGIPPSRWTAARASAGPEAVASGQREHERDSLPRRPRRRLRSAGQSRRERPRERSRRGASRRPRAPARARSRCARGRRRRAPPAAARARPPLSSVETVARYSSSSRREGRVPARPLPRGGRPRRARAPPSAAPAARSRSCSLMPLAPRRVRTSAQARAGGRARAGCGPSPSRAEAPAAPRSRCGTAPGSTRAARTSRWGGGSSASAAATWLEGSAAARGIGRVGRFVALPDLGVGIGRAGALAAARGRRRGSARSRSSRSSPTPARGHRCARARQTATNTSCVHSSAAWRSPSETEGHSEQDAPVARRRGLRSASVSPVADAPDELGVVTIVGHGEMIAGPGRSAHRTWSTRRSRAADHGLATID